MFGSNLLQSMRKLQDSLLDTITGIYQGQISVHLLTPEQLKLKVRTIHGQMLNDLSLPISNLDTDLSVHLPDTENKSKSNAKAYYF